MRLLVDLWRRVRGTERSRDLSDAVAVAVVGLLVLAVDVAYLWTDLPSPTWAGRWVHVATLAVGCLIMLGKRRRPMLALGAGLVIFGVDLALGGTLGVLLVLIDLIYSAALFAGPTAATRLRTGILAVISTATVLTLLASGDLRLTVLIGIQVFALLGTPLWWGTSVRQQSELAVLATARSEDLRRLADLREAEAVADERARMARDLHDAIAGNLSSIAIHAEAALAVPPDAEQAPARDRAALEAVRTASVTSLTEMRSMIGLLRAGEQAATAPPRLAEADGLLDTARAAGLRIRWSGTPLRALPVLPAAVDQAAFRILQEALTNATKHAPGSVVEIATGVQDGELALRASTTAVGHPGPRAAPGSGLGLLTMRERAEALGGRFAAGWEVVSEGGAGQGGAGQGGAGEGRGGAGEQPDVDGLRWTVRATLPLDTVEVIR